jgi:hypothetical protein
MADGDGFSQYCTVTIADTTERVAESIKGAVEELAEWVKNQPSVHVGESS